MGVVVGPCGGAVRLIAARGLHLARQLLTLSYDLPPHHRY